MRPWLVVIAVALVACASDDEESAPARDAGSVVTYGAPYTGGEFHLGPVDW
jgi:hypothetical protein